VELVFIAPEITPYSRSGELGDVCAALPKALRSGGHKVTVISPLWSGIDANARGLARRLSGVEATVGGQRYACTVHDGRTTGGVELVFIGHPEVFAIGPAGGDEQARLRAALVFVQAAAQVASAREAAPEVLHAHGWFAAGALVIAQASLSGGTAPAGAARVLSLHDPRQHGRVPKADAALEPAGVLGEALAASADRSLLRAGIAAAQRVVASSEAEAHELRAGTQGLQDAFAETGKLIAIASGLDAARWNTLTDPLLPARYDAVDLRGKARCKDQLQLELGLPIAPDVPLCACVGSLTAESGGALLGQALPALLQNELQLVIVGGDATLREAATQLTAKYEDRLRLVTADSGTAPELRGGASFERSAHRAIAAADLVLVPGRDPASAELHLCAQRYGALPVVRKVGAMADAVVDCDAELTTGTGFVFERDDAAELVATVQRALAAFARRKPFDALRRRGMKLDVSWERSARRYEHVYRTIIGAK
jgi:starch synthase